ncbi:hypothetical protein [Lysobacter zhanggongensis]|uniref:Uncharacterized protein n=1 Tax=Lysobacter zhanggongensis TaxID=1774951 RepID=A0ABU7YLJ6_9GAMM
MDLSHIKKHLANHPISFRVAGGSLTLFFVLGFVLASFGIHGLWAESTLKLIGENRAPGTFAVFFSVSLLYLSAKVAIRGSSFDPQGRLDRLLSVYIPNAALGIGAAYVGITTGAALAIGVFADDSISAPFELPELLWLCAKLLGGLLFTYLLFVFITISKSTAPGYATPNFQRNIRVISGLFFLALLGRSLLAIASAR